MFRADHITADPTANGVGKPGYTDGSVSLQVAPTRVTAAAMNALQEEIALAIEGAGITLSSGSNAQLLAAISALIAANQGTLITANLTASQDNYAPMGWSGAGVVRLDPDAAWTIRGFAASATVTRKLIVNVDATIRLTLKNNDGTQTAGNKILTPTGRDYLLQAGSSCWVYYDTTSAAWRIATDKNTSTDLAADITATYGFLAQAFTWSALHTFDVAPMFSDGLEAQNAIGTTDFFTYLDVRTTKLLIPLTSGNAGTSGDYTFSSYGSAYTIVDDAYLYVPMDCIPSGSIITKVRAGYIQTGSPGGGNEATLTLYKTAPNLVSGALSAPTAVDSATGDTAAGTHVMDTGTIAETVDRNSHNYLVALKAGGGSASATEFNWIEVSFTDPGPRND